MGKKRTGKNVRGVRMAHTSGSIRIMERMTGISDRLGLHWASKT